MDPHSHANPSSQESSHHVSVPETPSSPAQPQTSPRPALFQVPLPVHQHPHPPSSSPNPPALAANTPPKQSQYPQQPNSHPPQTRASNTPKSSTTQASNSLCPDHATLYSSQGQYSAPRIQPLHQGTHKHSTDAASYTSYRPQTGSG